jgi:hypothetical protein
MSCAELHCHFRAVRRSSVIGSRHRWLAAPAPRTLEAQWHGGSAFEGPLEWL